ncbi:WD40/YVTN/BNR-like repeat-containing protein [Halalkalibaculum sp. DA384]|uniref:WD40/YVTN/BNR-like repeat-containing protein n=1 Tax=Halalkalibaculum sp. DA384 TaxID=3373606 RepID=UPI0037551C60
MKKPTFALTSLVTTLILLLPPATRGQVVGPVPSPFRSIEQNSVSIMESYGDTLWIGPGLNRNIGNQEHWFLPEGADSVTAGRGRVYSLALAPDTVLAGLGFNLQQADGTVQTGVGYHLSTDGGDHWSFWPLPLDSEADTTLIYGGHSYRMLPIIVPQQSPPFEIDFSGKTVVTANWASGILRSRDFGQHWERLVLPPQSADQLVPSERYTFSTADGSNRYDPRSDQNLLGFSVLIDSNRNVWAGTAGGINISSNALSAPQDSVRWSHIQVDGSRLLGNWIIEIEQQPSTGDIWLTNWISGVTENEQYGVVRTGDGGKTFEPVPFLTGKRINDLGFMQNRVFAAGDEGLYISSDKGDSWREVEQIQSADSFIKASARYYSVAVTEQRVWIGTSDGLASTPDGGKTWEITRVNFPLAGGNQYQNSAPETDSFAYPNPFSPSRQEIVRIKFRVERQGEVKIRLFDFGMNLIRELENRSFAPGTYEAVWNGHDKNDERVANGPIFYLVESPGNTARGKILVLD